MHIRSALIEAHRSYFEDRRVIVAFHDVELVINPELSSTHVELDTYSTFTFDQSKNEDVKKIFAGGRIEVSQKLLDKFGDDGQALRAYFYTLLGDNLHKPTMDSGKFFGSMAALIFAIASMNDAGAVVTNSVISASITGIAYLLLGYMPEQFSTESRDDKCANRYSVASTVRAMEIQREFMRELRPQDRHQQMVKLDRRISQIQENAKADGRLSLPAITH